MSLDLGDLGPGRFRDVDLTGVREPRKGLDAATVARVKRRPSTRHREVRSPGERAHAFFEDFGDLGRWRLRGTMVTYGDPCAEYNAPSSTSFYWCAKELLPAYVGASILGCSLPS